MEIASLWNPLKYFGEPDTNIKHDQTIYITLIFDKGMGRNRGMRETSVFFLFQNLVSF